MAVLTGPGQFINKEKVHVTHCIGLLGPQRQSGHCTEEKNFRPPIRNRTQIPQPLSLCPSHCTYWNMQLLAASTWLRCNCRHGKLTCMLCMKRHLWIWHRAWCTRNACYGAQISSAASCSLNVVSIQILKQTKNKNAKLGNKTHQVDSCICGYLVHVSTLCLYSFNIKKMPTKNILPPHPLYPTILFGWWFQV
jgi:hypothetical protein